MDALATKRVADVPVRHKVKRRRIKTVMQELMFKAARMIHHAERRVLSEIIQALAVVERHYRHNSTT